jgi:hypothetical protein
MYRLVRIASRNIPLGAAALAILSVGCACRPVMAAPIAEREAPTTAPATAPIAERTMPMTLTVVPRAESGVFRDTTLVYLDGPIDAGAPDRLTKALDGVEGKIAVWLNSPGGNLFAGMQLGRTIRKRGASTHIIDYRTLLAGECFSACSLAFLGGVYRFNDNGARYGVHRASVGPTTGNVDLGPDLSVAIQNYIREMGVDARLFDLWAKAGPDEMYCWAARSPADRRRNRDPVLFLRQQTDSRWFGLRSRRQRRTHRDTGMESLADDRQLPRSFFDGAAAS